jgi:hypothetical protein
MFIVVYDRSAADDVVLFLREHGGRAWKRTPFVVEIDPSVGKAKAERALAEWRERHEGVLAELVMPSPRRDPTRI